MLKILHLTEHCLDKWKYDDQILTCCIVIKEYLKRNRSHDPIIGKRPSLISFADPEKRLRMNFTLPIGIIDLNHCDGLGEIISNS